MSLIRQIWLLLLGTLALALAASVTIHVSAARDTLQTQLRLKNSDNATVLAQALTQLQGDPASLELALTAQFDTGFYERIRLTGADGKLLFERLAGEKPLEAPAWFAALTPIESVPGFAQVSAGWKALGTVEVVSQAAYAHDELWRGATRSALALAAVGLIAGLIGWLVVREIRRPLEDTMRQARLLQRGEYVTVAEPRVPELRALTQAMNAMVDRLRTVFEGQAAQVEAMRRQSSCDALTGLSNRTHFMAQLREALLREDGHSSAGLILLRVLNLADVNRALGREGTDCLLIGLAQVMRTYVERVDGAVVGRLNGSDFALALPRSGVAAASAQALVDLMRASLSAIDGHVGVVAGVTEARHGAALSGVMASADMALAQAESAGPFSCEIADAALEGIGLAGETDWRERLRGALSDGRARLGEYAVQGRDGQLIHLECPLRLQLQPEGAFEVAAHWLPLALRSRLTPEIDEVALALALEAIARDGRPRCVNIAPASLSDSGFAARLRGRLQRAPQAAALVSLEVAESAAIERFELVRELSRQVRATGARFGLEHAGERLGRVERLLEAELDFVKIDGSVTHGVGTDAGRAAFFESLATLLHSLSIAVIAEGVNDPQDAAALWAAQADGITGPWLTRTAGADA